MYCSRSTFYKYCRLLQITCNRKKKKNIYNPLRATAPLQILHLDVTLYKLINGTKVYLHVVRDNFSRAVLACKIATACCSQNSKEIMEEVLKKYNLMEKEGQLITDGGSENKGALQEWLNKPGMLWKKLIAQIDIVQSNSMVEAANKMLKYGFLHHLKIETLPELAQQLPTILTTYNDMPLGCLHGCTPNQVLAGKIPDKKYFAHSIKNAQSQRVIKNGKIVCKNPC
ncbi:MAG: DDE-type integrase/transposase/recombinase [Ferruginibacter sp.]